MIRQSNLVRSLRGGLAFCVLGLALAPVPLAPAQAADAKAKVEATQSRALTRKARPKALPKNLVIEGPKVDFPRQAKVPAAARPSVPPVVPGGAVDPRIRHLPDAAAARGLEAARGAAEALRKLPGAPTRGGGLTDIPGANLGGQGGRTLDLTTLPGREDRGGYENPLGKLAPDLPGQDRRRNPLIPSADPRDWSAGLATSGDDEGAAAEGVRPGTETEITRDKNGEIREVASVRTHEDGRTSYLRTTFGRDGSTTYEGQDRDGNVYREHYPPGRPVPARSVSDVDRGILRRPGRPSGGGIDRTQDPNADGGGGAAVLCYAMPWKCRVEGPKPNLDRVRPGPDAAQGGFVPTPRIDLRRDMVVNPSPEAPIQAGDPEAARRLLEEGPRLPHSEPGDPRGER